MPLIDHAATLTLLGLVTLSLAPTAQAEADVGLHKDIAERTRAVAPKLVAWRRDIHAHPELGNKETRTAEIVAGHLRALGLEVRTQVARTGVVAVLRGKRPGAVVGLRADMDGLRGQETTGLSFASKDQAEYLGEMGPVMHACGHDAHTAILMATAQVLAELKDQLRGSVVFYFQPAEEGPSDFRPDGKNTWGARMMVEEGALDAPRPAAIFALHVWAGVPAGRIVYRSGPTMASSDDLSIRIRGVQTHAGSPWNGVDPIVASAQTILGLQTIVSRQINVFTSPTVLSIGTIHGGSRYNIIPEVVEMEGTVRTYDPAQRRDTHQRIRRMVEQTAAASGAKGEAKILEKYGVTVNDPKLTARAGPALQWAAQGDVGDAPQVGGAEDFSFMADKVPAFFFFLGATAPKADMKTALPNHNPGFSVDESTLLVGVRAMSALAADFLDSTLPAGK